MRSVIAFTVLLLFPLYANATIIDVVTVGASDSGHKGTLEDPLVPSEQIQIAIVLNYNPYPGWPSYDGYALEGMGLRLYVSGPGILDVPGIYLGNDRVGDDLMHHEDWDGWVQSGNMDGTVEGYEPLIVDNNIDRMFGAVFGGCILGSNPPDGNGPPPSPTKLVWNLFIIPEGYGQIHLDLTLGASTFYWDYTNPTGGSYGDTKVAIDNDLGDLMLYAIPEPVTIALLGLGGLILLKKKPRV